MTALASVSDHLWPDGVVVSADGNDGWLYLATMPDGTFEAQPGCVAAALARVRVSPPLGISMLLACRAIDVP